MRNKILLLFAFSIECIVCVVQSVGGDDAGGFKDYKVEIYTFINFFIFNFVHNLTPYKRNFIKPTIIENEKIL